MAVRVIVADDQNISRGFFEMYVRAAVGYELAGGFRAAKEAVEYLDEHEADLLILDVMMQDGIDGLSAARLIKEKHPQVKIILTTSASETSWEKEAAQIGVTVANVSGYVVAMRTVPPPPIEQPAVKR